MDLKKRLANLDRLTRRRDDSAAEAPRPTGETPPEADAGPPGDGFAAALDLDVASGAAGPYWRRERRTPLPSPDLSAADLVGFFPHLPPTDCTAEDLLFMDTETTGLAGGTGTLAFLVGLAWWEGDVLVSEQVFLPSPGREAGLLAAVAERARQRRVVVSYNGAAFDLPLLRTRALLNRIADPLTELTSWDLLVPVRRLWQRRLPDCRQQTAEAAAGFGDRGSGDIPGFRIPQTWFDFLATGRPGELAAVLEHNRWDLLGMAVILCRLAEAARELAAGQVPVARPWRDRWSLARIAFQDGPHGQLSEKLKETCAVAFGYDDPVAVAKVLSDYAKTSKKFAFRFASLEGQFLDEESIKELAKLPGREELLAKLLGTMNAVPTNFVGVLANVLRTFLYALNAIKDQKEAA